MKQLAILIVSLMLLSCSVLAAEAEPMGIHEPGTGIADPELREEHRAEMAEEMGLDEMPGPNAVNAQNNDGVLSQERNRLREESGKRFLQAGERRVGCEICEQDGEKLRAKLSNGKNAEIKIMPDRASEVALQRLRLKLCAEGCSLELREVNARGEPRPAYQMKTEREARVFGLFKTRMQVEVDVDAETEEVLRVGKPWWAFLASEPEE